MAWTRQTRIMVIVLLGVLASTVNLTTAAPACAHPVDSACDLPLPGQEPGEDVVSAAEIATYDDSAANAVGDAPAMSSNITHLANLPKSGPLADGTGSDLAFWGDFAFQGNYNGLQITDISDPADPTRVSQLECPGSQNDVSVWGTLVIMSVDSRRADDSCGSAGATVQLPIQDYWEGLRVVDWSDPAAPRVIANVETDCGSHTHTLYPQAGRLVVYVSSYSPSPQQGNCLPPHDKISVVEVPLADPAAARVVAEPVLFDQLPLPGATFSEAGTSGCHDITVLPARQLAAGACMGQGILMDVSDPEAPVVVSSVTDGNFAFWHSATFSNDGNTVIFTDELGGGNGPECNPTVGEERGADALYDITDPENPAFLSYFKIPRTQTNQENCVAHNGVVLPTGPGGRDLFVQAWYQGGITVMDFTDRANPTEIAFFDRPPFDPARLVGAGSWSAYWYRGHIFSNGLQEGLDVLRLDDPRVGAAAGVVEPYLNAQLQCAPASSLTTCL